MNFKIYSNQLEPNIWTSEKILKSDVRLNLLKIADDFYKSTDLTIPILDILFLGSCANYTYNSNSDIDLHILVDETKLSKNDIPENNIKKYFKLLSYKWNKEHEIIIKGHKIEIYIQTKKEKNRSTGVYSLIENKWIKEPDKYNIKLDHNLIKNKYYTITRKIDDSIKSENIDKLNDLMKNIVDMREKGLSSKGEMSYENIVFKILRSSDYIKRLKDAITNIYDKSISITENMGDISSKNFTVKFNEPGVSKGIGKIFLNNDNWFANSYKDNLQNNKWIINRHKGAFDLKFPDINKQFNTIEELLQFLENWLENNNKTNEGYGLVNYKDDPKATGHWTVKYDSIKTNELKEIKFRKYKSKVHIIDVPMFSIFADATLGKKDLYKIKNNIEHIKKMFNEARNEIHKIGFPSMHSNVVFTRIRYYAGLAHSGLKYMTINFDNISSKKNRDITDVIVHEWAHLWMFNNSKKFKEAIKKLYNSMIFKAKYDLINSNLSKIHSNLERDVLARWHDCFTSLLSSFNTYPYNEYILKHRKFDSNFLKYLPHLFQINGILKQDLLTQDLSGQRVKKLLKGQKVYALKIHYGWIIGVYYSDGTRFETITKEFDSIFEYLDSENNNSDIINDIYTEFIKRIKTNENIEEIVRENILKHFTNGAQYIFSHFYIDPSEDTISTIQYWINNYITPQIIKILKNDMDFKNITDKSVYDKLWTGNELKPEETSFWKLFKKLYVDKLCNNTKNINSLLKYCKDADTGLCLWNDKEKEMLTNLNKWVTAYGMTDDLELWATAIQYFFRLNRDHQKTIINLML